MFSPAKLSQLTSPSYKLTIDALAAGIALKDRLISLSVVLNNGQISDQLSMIFDDRPRSFGDGISLPRQGVSIDVSMGYEAYLEKMGSFQVNQISLNGSSNGRTMTVSATPALLLTDNSRTWKNDIASIVKTIAEKHGLTAKVSSTFSLKTITVINQWNESDLLFLTRLAARYNAVCKPMAGNLLFMEKGQGTSASGLPLLPINIEPQDIIEWSKQLSEREDYTKVIAYWPDLIQAEYVEAIATSKPETSQSNDNIYRMPHAFNTEAEAKAAAESKLEELNRSNVSLNMTLIGNPAITAEGKIIVSDLRSSVDGSWIVKSATHTLSSGGYQTSLQAYQNQMI